MAAGDLITEDYQYEYNGLLLGVNTGFHVKGLTNLGGYPSVRSTSSDRFGHHGSVPGHHYLPQREFVFEFDCTPVDDDAFATARNQIQTAFGVRSDPMDEIPFVFMHPGRNKLQINARPIAIDMPTDRNYALKYPQVQIRFEASYPFFFDVSSDQVTINATGDITGLDLPLDFPLDFGASLANSELVTNNGTAPAHWIATMLGPAVNPHLEESVNGDHIHLNLELLAGETLTIDSMFRTILLNGTSSRRYALATHSHWFQLQPGIETGIRYTVSGVGGATSCSFEWRDTYWSD